MNRGIYIIANDKVIEHAIALLNSIRLHDDVVNSYFDSAVINKVHIN